MKNQKALYAGSFDPPTSGHLDIILRASQIFNELIIGIGINTRKKSLLTPEERVNLLNKITKDIKNIQIVSYSDMTISYARSIGAKILIRGLRNPADFQLEFQMSLINKILAPEMETVFLNSSSSFIFLNSSLVREVVALGGDISNFVPSEIANELNEILPKRIKNL